MVSYLFSELRSQETGPLPTRYLPVSQSVVQIISQIDSSPQLVRTGEVLILVWLGAFCLPLVLLWFLGGWPTKTGKTGSLLVQFIQKEVQAGIEREKGGEWRRSMYSLGCDAPSPQITWASCILLRGPQARGGDLPCSPPFWILWNAPSSNPSSGVVVPQYCNIPCPSPFNSAHTFVNTCRSFIKPSWESLG